MKTILSRALLTALAAFIAFPSSGWGLDLRIPHPKKLVREARGAIHRVANEAEDAGRRVVRGVDSDRQSSAQRSRSSGASEASRKSLAPNPSTAAGNEGQSSTVKPSLSEAELVPQSSSGVQPTLTDPTAKGSSSSSISRETATVPGRGSGDRPLPSKPLPESADSRSTAKTTPPMRGSQAPALESNGAPDRSKAISDAPFARPVPGKKGMVYTPGSEETAEAMVDVRDFAPGTLVRNPRTGVLFRVP